MDLTSFYVMISRVTTSAGLRVLSKDKFGDTKIKQLRWPKELYSWERSFDSAGRFSVDLCKKAASEKAILDARSKTKANPSEPRSPRVRVR